MRKLVDVPFDLPGRLEFEARRENNASTHACDGAGPIDRFVQVADKWRQAQVKKVLDLSTVKVVVTSRIKKREASFWF